MASTTVPLPHMDLVAMSNSVTSPVPSSLRTVRPANSSRLPRSPAGPPRPRRCSPLSWLHAFSTALPVT